MQAQSRLGYLCGECNIFITSMICRYQLYIITLKQLNLKRNKKNLLMSPEFECNLAAANVIKLEQLIRIKKRYRILLKGLYRVIQRYNTYFIKEILSTCI